MIWQQPANRQRREPATDQGGYRPGGQHGHSTSTYLSPAWDLAILGFDLDQTSQKWTPATIASRLSVATVLARAATADGLDPKQVTKTWLQKYLVGQYARRQGRGAVNLYQNLVIFWRWWSADEGAGSPMEKIPRPKGGSAAEVPVLEPAEIDALRAVCKGSARDLAIVSLLLGSGLRRAELCALDWSCIDLKRRTVTVLHGKARVSVMDDDAVTAIWKWRKQRPEASGAVFVNRYGAPLGARQRAIWRLSDVRLRRPTYLAAGGRGLSSRVRYMQVPEINPRAPDPPYRQVADWLRGRIAAGDFRPELDPLPSEKELTELFGIARDTARRAVQVLRDEGLVVTVPQRGTYVRDT